MHIAKSIFKKPNYSVRCLCKARTHSHRLGLGLQRPAQPRELLSAREDTTHGKSASCRARILAGRLPSVPVGQGETGPSYPGRYKAHRCKCREHLRLPPLSGSTRLPAGSSQNTAAVRKRELTYPTPTAAYYFPFSQAPHLSPGRLSHPPGHAQFNSQHPNCLLNGKERKRGQDQPVQTQPSGKGCPALYVPNDKRVYLAAALLPTPSQASSSSPKRFNMRIYPTLSKTHPGGTKETTPPEGLRAPRARNPQQQQV